MAPLSYTSRISQNNYSQEFPMIATFSLDLQSFWLSCSKPAPSFYVFCVVITVKICHPFIHLRTFARKTSTIQIFFILWLQSDNESPMSEMPKNWGVTDFVFKIKRVENYPNCDKSALATRHGLSAC